MKISEMNPDQVLDTLVVLTPYLLELFEDTKIITIFDVGAIPLQEDATDEEKAKYKKSLNKIGMQRFGKLIDHLVSNYREMAMAIFAALNLQTVDEFRKNAGFITMAKTVIDVKSDKDLIDFFMSFAQSAQEIQSDTLQK